MAEQSASEEKRLEDLRRKRRESRTSTTYMNFLKSLSEIGNLTHEEGERASVSVLCTLQQRLTSDEADDLEAQLPVKLQELLHRCERHEGAPPERFGRDEFIAMIGEDLNVSSDEAESRVRIVFTAVRSLISEGEAEDVASQLPPDLEALWRRPS